MKIFNLFNKQESQNKVTESTPSANQNSLNRFVSMLFSQINLFFHYFVFQNLHLIQEIKKLELEHGSLEEKINIFSNETILNQEELSPDLKIPDEQIQIPETLHIEAAKTSIALEPQIQITQASNYEAKITKSSLPAKIQEELTENLLALQAKEINKTRKISQSEIEDFLNQLSLNCDAINKNLNSEESIENFITKNKDRLRIHPLNNNSNVYLIPANVFENQSMRFVVNKQTGQVFIPLKNIRLKPRLPLIGKGSFKKVYYALDVNKKELVVVWTLKISSGSSQRKKDLDAIHKELKFHEILENEAHVAQMYSSAFYQGKSQEKVIGISPYYSKGDLASADLASIEQAEECKIWIQVLKGLKAIHEHNIVHRDIKPENILLDGNNNALIADFGLACFSEGITGSGGTYEFIPPEVFSKGDWTVDNPKAGDNFACGMAMLHFYLRKSKNPMALKAWEHMTIQLQDHVFKFYYSDPANEAEKINSNRSDYLVKIISMLEEQNVISQTLKAIIYGLTLNSTVERMKGEEALSILENAQDNLGEHLKS